jgi:Tol biopolymer transport system component
VLYKVPVLGGTSKKLLEDMMPYAVSFSPDGKRFAFTRRAPVLGEEALMTANADGTGEQKLAALKYPDRFRNGVAWSPDGKTIACPIVGLTGGFYTGVNVIQLADGTQKTLFSHRWYNVGRIAWVSDGSGIIITAPEQSGSPAQIWQASFTEGEPHKITNEVNDYSDASLTADSTALVSVLTDRTSNVWASPAGEWNNIRQLTSGKGNGEPVWTPNGKIVYISRTGGNTDIWIMDADGRNQKQLTDDGSYKRGSLCATPDGRYVVFSSFRTGTFQLWRIDIDGANPKQLTTGVAVLMPHCSPDSKWVAYTSSGSSGNAISRVSIDGGEPVQLTDKLAIIPAFSPDGRVIACYLTDPQTRVTKVALLPFEGGDPIKVFDLPQTADRAQAVRWTPDGRSLIYVNTRGLVSNIWLQPIDGTPARQLTNFTADRIFSFDWSGDGKQLACARGVENRDVVLIKDFR